MAHGKRGSWRQLLPPLLLLLLLLLLAVSQAGKLATRVWPFMAVGSKFFGYQPTTKLNSCLCVCLCMSVWRESVLATSLIWSVELSINTRRILSCRKTFSRSMTKFGPAVGLGILANAQWYINWWTWLGCGIAAGTGFVAKRLLTPN